MNSEKVKEIKKVLEEGLFNTIKHHQKEGKPILISFADILTLINELESENERWQEKEGALSCDLDYINEKLTNAEIEVDDYKDRIAELEKEKKTIKESCNRGIDRIHELSIKIAELKEEKQKQLLDFVKALKTITCEMYLKEQLHGAIDITLKNFVKDI